MYTCKRRWFGLFVVVFLLSSVSSALGVPVPLGIDGVVYELDGVTQVSRGTPFSVENLNSGRKISGTTGHGSRGRYSVSLSGNIGDTVVVRAWTEYNSVEREVVLDGVMHDVHLLLNTSEPDEVVGGDAVSFDVSEGLIVEDREDLDIDEGNGGGQPAIIEEFERKHPIKVSGIEQHFVMAGYVVDSSTGEQVTENTAIDFRNLETREGQSGFTGVGPLSGAFAVQMRGHEGDAIEVIIDGEHVFWIDLEDNLGLTFEIEKQRDMLAITGESILGLGPSHYVLSAFALLIVFGIVSLIVIVLYRPKR